LNSARQREIYGETLRGKCPEPGSCGGPHRTTSHGGVEQETWSKTTLHEVFRQFVRRCCTIHISAASQCFFRRTVYRRTLLKC